MSQRPQSGRGGGGGRGGNTNSGRGGSGGGRGGGAGSRGGGGPNTVQAAAALGAITFSSSGEWKIFWGRVMQLAASNEAELFSLEFNRNCIVELAAMLNTAAKVELKKQIDNADVYLRSAFQSQIQRPERCRDFEHIGFLGNSCKLSINCNRIHLVGNLATDHMSTLADVNKSTPDAHPNLNKKHHGKCYAVGENIHFILDRQSERVDPALNLLHDKQDELQGAEVNRISLTGRLGALLEQATADSMAYTTAKMAAKEKGLDAPASPVGNRPTRPLAVGPKGTLAIGCEVNSSFPVIAIDPIQTKLYDDAFRVSTKPMTEEEVAQLRGTFPELSLRRPGEVEGEVATATAGGGDGGSNDSTKKVGAPGSSQRYRRLTLEVFTPNIWDQVIAGGDELLSDKSALEARTYLESIYLGNKFVTKLWPRWMGPKCSLSPEEPRPCIVSRSEYLYDFVNEKVICFLPKSSESSKGVGKVGTEAEAAPGPNFSMELDFVKPNYQLEYELVDRFLKSKTRKPKNAVEYSLKLADRLAFFLTTPNPENPGSMAAVKALGLDTFCVRPWADTVRMDHSGRDRYCIKVGGNVRGHSRGHFIVDTFVDTVNYAGGQVFNQAAAAEDQRAQQSAAPTAGDGGAGEKATPAPNVSVLDQVLVLAPEMALTKENYAELAHIYRMSYGEGYNFSGVGGGSDADSSTSPRSQGENFDAVSNVFHARGIHLTELRAGMGLNNRKRYYTMSEWAAQDDREATHHPSVSITKPLRSYSCAYHQYLLLNLLDPKTDRSSIAHLFPQNLNEVNDLASDLTTRHQGHRRAKQEKDLSVAAVVYDLFPVFAMHQNALVLANKNPAKEDGKILTIRLCSDHGVRTGPLRVNISDCRDNGGTKLEAKPGTILTALCFRGNVVALRDSPPKQSMTSTSHRLLRGVNV